MEDAQDGQEQISLRIQPEEEGGGPWKTRHRIYTSEIQTVTDQESQAPGGGHSKVGTILLLIVLVAAYRTQGEGHADTGKK